MKTKKHVRCGLHKKHNEFILAQLFVSQYEQRLIDSKPMIAVLKAAWKYYDSLKMKNVQAAIYTEIMSLTYYDYSKKLDCLYDIIKNAKQKQQSKGKEDSNEKKENKKVLVQISTSKNTEMPFGGKEILNLYPNVQ